MTPDISQSVESFSIAPASGQASSVTVSPGGTASYSLSVLPPQSGPNLTLSVTGLPSGADYNFSQGATLPPPGGAPVNVGLDVSTVVAAATNGDGPLQRPAPPVALGFLLLPLAALFRFGARRRILLLSLCLIPTLAALGLSAYGSGGGGSSGSGGGASSLAVGTYTFKVTANSASLSQSTQLTLVVQ